MAWDNDPLTPVTMTGIVEPELNMQDSVEDPEPVTVVGERLHAELFVERLTTPLNPLWAVTLIAEVPADPAFTVNEVGLAEMLKSDGGVNTYVAVVV